MNSHYNELDKVNRLIVEFMGATIVPNQGEAQIDHFILSGETYAIWDLKYHMDWNWLMPVVDKIRNMKMEDIPLLPMNGIKESVMPFLNAKRPITKALLEVNILKLCATVGLFLVWYNENKGFIGAA